MDARTQELVVTGVIGLVAGWLASWIVGGGGIIQYLISGILGAYIGEYAVRATGFNIGIQNPLVARLVTATVGAMGVVLIAHIIV